MTDLLLCQTVSALQILQVVSLSVVLRLQCPRALDVLKHDGTASAAAVTLCFLFLRFLRDSCMTVGGWEKEMAHSLSTFIITSGETVFSSAPQRGKTCAMMQPAHDQQWNSLATNSIINFLFKVIFPVMLQTDGQHPNVKSFAVHSAVTSLQQTPKEK